MKKILVLALLVSFVSYVSGQTINASLVPQVVKTKMQEKYPEAKGVYWKQSDAGFVESNFTNDGRKCNAIFLTTGGWVSTDCEITVEEFPVIGATYLADPKNADKVTKYYQSDTKAKGKQFSADVKKDGKSLQYIFDADGNLIMKGPKN
ncbi:MAG: hypothetical protein IPO83_12985 [Chitinophagaceae bacterium]|nr:hypothetical protein [Chitinophagaceae bacterium]